MNILFVNYGDFTSNSLNHIAGFANTLSLQGHSCIVAVPERKESSIVITQQRFIPALFEELLQNPTLFPDGRSADIVHAWTPRENVRKFVVGYQRAAAQPARVIVHLEDNEQFLLERFTGKTFDDLRSGAPLGISELLQNVLTHPLRYESFLRVADGITHIVDSLVNFAPASVPTQQLPPGVDFTAYYPQNGDPALRAELRIRPEEKVIVFTGSATFANLGEMSELYLAIARLNQEGVPTRLIRTGFNVAGFLENLGVDSSNFAIELGFVEKAKLPKLLALADVLVQPGTAGAFNDYRLPSKLPEFLAMGKPVILPNTNIGKQMIDGRDALLLQTGSPEEIAGLCRRVFGDLTLSSRLGENAVAFAHEHFDLNRNTASLLGFYGEISARPARVDWTLLKRGAVSEIALLASQIERQISAQHSTDAPAGETEANREFRLLSHLIRELEDSLESFRSSEAQKALEADRSHWKTNYDQAAQRVDVLKNELSLTHAHAENLQKLAHAAKVDANRLELQRLELERQLTDARTKLQAFEQALLQVEAEVVRLDDRAEQMRLHNHELVFQRDEKIRKMQESFSWKATSWLRALRRKFVDPYKAKEEPRTPARLPPREPSPYNPKFGTISAHVPNAPVYRFCIDYPNTWSFRPGKVLIRGWCFSNDATKITALRAKIGTRFYQGVYGLKRLDVLASLRQFPQAEYCGFKLEVDFALDDSQILFEVAAADGVYHRFFLHELSVSENGGREELTSYEKWIEAFDKLGPEEIKVRTARAESFSYRPLISVLIPVYNTPEKWLQLAVDSVRAQIYPNWELCIADDASPAPHVRPFLEKLAASDPRVKVVFREKNGHISAASNSALELAKGEFIALLDHDDELRPHALFEVVDLLNADAVCDLVYSDEDKIDESGKRHEPYFKPDFLPDLYLAQNYTSHLSVYRTSVVRAVGGFRVGYEGSQDWDLGIRVLETIGPKRVRHIPKILYHWRAIPGSTAFLLSEKNYPLEAAKRALIDHFSRQKKTVEVVPVPGDHWRIKYALPAVLPKVSIIIPTRNRCSLLQQCVESILKQTQYPDFEILIVDNHSDEPDALAYFAKLRIEPRVRVLEYPHPFNYSAINNFAAKQAAGEVVALLNNDLQIISPDWLDEMVSQAVRPEIGCVGAMLYYPNDHIQHAGVVVGVGGVAGHAFRDLPRGAAGKFNRARLAQNYTAVTAACLVIRKSIYEQVGGFDEKALHVAFNDVDFCLKVRAAGYWNLWTPFAELYHHESASRGAEDTPEKHERFRSEVETMLARWPDELAHDPAYNVNLTLELSDFSLAAPPRPFKHKRAGV